MHRTMLFFTHGLKRRALSRVFGWIIRCLLRRKIFEYIVNTLGSLERMDGRIRHLMGEMLKKNLANVGSATDNLLHRLGQN